MLAAMGVTLVLVVFLSMLLLAACSTGALQLRNAASQISLAKVRGRGRTPLTLWQRYTALWPAFTGLAHHSSGKRCQ